MNPGLKFSVQTLGCKLNFSESSSIAKQFEEAGYARVDIGEAPDILLINTCSVTENADKKCRGLIRKARIDNADLYVVVTGCYAQLKPKEISTMPGVNLVLGASEKFNVIDHIEKNYRGKTRVISSPIKNVTEFIPSYSIGDRTRSFLKVQDGCDYFCTFCTIPLARGLSRSSSVETCVNQAREIAAKGVKEVVLTGVNIGDFGAGRDEKFIDLIRELDKVDGIERFRISSIEPNLLSNEIIDFVATSNKFMPHFHIPLQSGSDRILELMKRKYKTELFKQRVEKIKSVLPNACIGVDVITGFPDETEHDFKLTLDFLNDLNVSYLHVFTYSERANTRASRSENSVPVHIRRERSRELQELSGKMKRAFYTTYKDKNYQVLFEKSEGGVIEGFTPNYIRVAISGDREYENKLITVKLKSLDIDDVMKAEVCNLQMEPAT